MRLRTNLLLLVLLGAFTLSFNSPVLDTNENVERQLFGVLPDGTEVFSYTLKNINGLEMKVINYGGIITSLSVPDKDGNIEDIVMGHNELAPYLKDNPFFGALVGRYGNRIAGGEFTLDDKVYELETNNGPNHLHGGSEGFDKKFWDIEPFKNKYGMGLKLSCLSPDGDQGYPGSLLVHVTYFLSSDNTLEIDYTATTSKKTVVNMTQHSYFNLSAMKDDILNQELVINADRYLVVDRSLIPTGEQREVSNTPFDFRSPKEVGQDINSKNEQMEFGHGYDHCWVLNASDEKIPFAASLYDPTSGRFMEVFTTEPGIQLYTGNFLDGSKVGKNGEKYVLNGALCLETQHYPDSPNQPDFPSTELNPGETYHTITAMKFSVK